MKNLPLALLAGCTLINATLFAQAPAAAPPSNAYNSSAASAPRSNQWHDNAALLGVLTFTNVTITFDQTPVRDAITRLANLLSIQIIGRYSDDSIGFGIDPTILVSLEANEQDAMSVLEEILTQCEVFDDCTWQLRKGYVEVSTKERLSVPAAREVRTYAIRDLMLEPPRFATQPDETTPDLGKYGTAMLGKPAGAKLSSYNPMTHNKTITRRKMPEELAMEIVEGIVETIEPGNWDYGQDDGKSKDDDGKSKPELKPTPGSGSGSSAAPIPPAAQPRCITGVGKWASIRLWRDELIIRAPDFIHRQIDGYPKPTRPAVTSVKEIAAAAVSAPPTTKQLPSVSTPKP